MFSYSQVRDLPVHALLDNVELGRIAGLVIDPESMCVRWFSINSGGRLNGRHRLSADQVHLLAAEGMTITDEAEIKQPKEAWVAERIVRSGRTLIGHHVTIGDGQVLGKIGDFHFDSATWKLIDLVIPATEGLLGNGLIIQADQIDKIIPDAILVSRDGRPARAELPAHAASTAGRNGVRAAVATMLTTLMPFHH